MMFSAVHCILPNDRCIFRHIKHRDVIHICLILRGRLVRRRISEGMESVKGMESGRNWNEMLSGLTKCLVDRNEM